MSVNDADGELAVRLRPGAGERGPGWRRGWRAVRPLLTTGSGRRLGDAAAECAFFVALAVLPMMLTTTAALRALRPTMGRDITPQVEEGLARMLRVVLTTRGGVASDAAGRLLTSDNGGVLTLGTVVSLLVVARAMRSVLTGLHAVRGPDGDTRTYTGPQLWTVASLLAVAGVFVGALTLAMIAVGPLLGHTRDIAPGAAGVVAGVWFVLRWPIGLLAVFGYVLLIQRAGLRRPRAAQSRRRPALLGAAVTTVGAVAASLVLPLYVRIASSVSPTTGALGGGLILLLWAYLLMVSLMLGAQVRVRLEQRSRRSS